MKTEEQEFQLGYSQDVLEEQEASGTFLDSAYFSPESVLPTYFLTHDPEPFTIKPAVPKAATMGLHEVTHEPPSSPGWLGLIASVSVGMIIAIFLFPMIEYTKRSTRSYVTDSWVSEINRRVDQYEQIHGNPSQVSQMEDLLPLNLALSGWQELYPETLAGEALVGSLFTPLETGASFSANVEHIENIHAGQLPTDSEWFSLNATEELQEIAEWYELFTPNTRVQIYVPDGESTARSAFGQGIMIQDGRVFVRVLPGMEPRR